MPRYTGVLVACCFVLGCFGVTGTTFPAFWQMLDRSDAGSVASAEPGAHVRPSPGKASAESTANQATISPEPAPVPASVDQPIPIQEAMIPQPVKLEPLSEIEKTMEPPGEPEKTTQTEPPVVEVPEPAEPELKVPEKQPEAKPVAPHEEPMPTPEPEAVKINSLPLPKKSETPTDLPSSPWANIATPQLTVADGKITEGNLPEPARLEMVQPETGTRRPEKVTLMALDPPPSVPGDPEFAQSRPPVLPAPKLDFAEPGLPYAENKAGKMSEMAKPVKTEKIVERVDKPSPRTGYGLRDRADAIRRLTLSAELPPNPVEGWWGERNAPR